MPRFLIEVPHEEEKAACLRAVRIFLDTGSHFLVNADWGCYDGEHKAWIMVEVESKQEALYIVPPSFRPQARIVQLNRFTMEEVDDMMDSHEG
jgi:hypothetical protein